MNKKEKNYLDSLSKFFHDLAVFDLRMQNTDKVSLDITFNDMLYLNIIEAYPKKYSASMIADLLKVSRPYVTQKIKMLIEKNYIIKHQDPKDLRVFYLEVNQNGYPANYNNNFLSAIKKMVTILKEYNNDDEIENFFKTLSTVGDILLEESKKY